MKITTFGVDNKARIGVVVDGGLVDATGWLEGETNLQRVIAGGRLDELKALTSARPDYTAEEVQFRPPIMEGHRIIAVGVNYDAHRKETGRAQTEHPTLFIRWPSSVVGHREALVRPSVSTRFDYEGELAVIIGKAAHHVRRDQALQHIAGYSCFHDGTIRDYQRHTSQFTPGKNFDRTGGFGPWMVTPEVVSDPSSLTLTTRLNREIVQQAPTADLIFDVPHLIEYISSFTTLQPGDVIATGTPSGVGDKRTPPRYLQPGDTLEVEISSIGTLAHPVVDEATA